MNGVPGLRGRRQKISAGHQRRYLVHSLVVSLGTASLSNLVDPVAVIVVVQSYGRVANRFTGLIEDLSTDHCGRRHTENKGLGIEAGRSEEGRLGNERRS